MKSRAWLCIAVCCSLRGGRGALQPPEIIAAFKHNNGSPEHHKVLAVAVIRSSRQINTEFPAFWMSEGALLCLGTDWIHHSRGKKGGWSRGQGSGRMNETSFSSTASEFAPSFPPCPLWLRDHHGPDLQLCFWTHRK